MVHKTRRRNHSLLLCVYFAISRHVSISNSDLITQECIEALQAPPRRLLGSSTKHHREQPAQYKRLKFRFSVPASYSRYQNTSIHLTFHFSVSPRLPAHPPTRNEKNLPEARRRELSFLGRTRISPRIVDPFSSLFPSFSAFILLWANAGGWGPGRG